MPNHGHCKLRKRGECRSIVAQSCEGNMAKSHLSGRTTAPGSSFTVRHTPIETETPRSAINQNNNGSIITNKPPTTLMRPPQKGIANHKNENCAHPSDTPARKQKRNTGRKPQWHGCHQVFPPPPPMPPPPPPLHGANRETDVSRIGMDVIRPPAIRLPCTQAKTKTDTANPKKKAADLQAKDGNGEATDRSL